MSAIDAIIFTTQKMQTQGKKTIFGVFWVEKSSLHFEREQDLIGNKVYSAFAWPLRGDGRGFKKNSTATGVAGPTNGSISVAGILLLRRCRVAAHFAYDTTRRAKG